MWDFCRSALRRGLAVWAVSGVFLLLSASAPASVETLPSYLVRLEDTVTKEAGEDLLKAAGFKVAKYIRGLQIYVATPQDAVPLTLAELAQLKQRISSIRYIEVNATIQIDPWMASEGSMRNSTRAVVPAVPNDEFFSEQYQMRRMKVEAAWTQISNPSQVVVGVIDSGIDMTHPDLRNQIWRNPLEIPGNGIDDDGNGYIDDVQGWDFYQGDNSPQDSAGHGTHVSGIIAAEAGNGVGVAGVNTNARIMPLRFLNSRGSGTTSDAIEAIIYGSDMGARILNLSWGSYSYSAALNDAIQYASAKGVLLLAAGGNHRENTDRRPYYPSGYLSSTLLSVGSSIEDGVLSEFSNYGWRSVHLVAPGSNILSTYLSGKWKSISGTSMASPMAAGVASLILSVKPELTPIQLRNAVLNAADVREVYRDWISTEGDLSAERAVSQLAQGFQVWPKRVHLKVGGTHRFSAYAANGEVSWSVDQPAVASIDSAGRLKGLKAGRVMVSAEDQQGRVASTQALQIR